jgi:hypothetical protein
MRLRVLSWMFEYFPDYRVSAPLLSAELPCRPSKRLLFPSQPGMAPRAAVLLIKSDAQLRTSPLRIVATSRGRLKLMAASCTVAALLTLLTHHWGGCRSLRVDPSSRCVGLFRPCNTRVVPGRLIIVLPIAMLWAPLHLYLGQVESAHELAGRHARCCDEGAATGLHS